MPTRIRSAAFATAVIVVAAVAPSAAAQPDPAPSAALQAAIEGRWESLACELRPQPYQEGAAVAPFHLTREFTYRGAEFDGTITAYADGLCEAPLASYSFTGHLVGRGPSPAADGAEQVDYVLDQALSLTPLSPLFLELLNGLPAGACGADAWELGVEQSILEGGCVLLGLAPGEVYVDHDILYARGDMLFFGAKPVDGSNFDVPENRPTQLQVPLVRVE